MSELRIDANKVINKLNEKLAEANLQITILELQVSELEALLTQPSSQEVIEPTEVIE